MNDTLARATDEVLDRVHHRNWLHYVARAGYAARGVVYLIVGFLATLAAWGLGGAVTDTRGALRTLVDQPWGLVALGAITFGLLGHAIWRFFQAGADVDRHGADHRGLAIRGGLLISGFAHVSLAAYAASLAWGWNPVVGGSDGDGARSWSAAVLSYPLGQFVLGLVGLVVIGVGAAQFYKGYRATYRRRIDFSSRLLRRADPLCRFGLMMRSMVFGLIGLFLILAAWNHDAGSARGFAAALDEVRKQPLGWAWLTALGLGLMSFALYSFVAAAGRRFPQ